MKHFHDLVVDVLAGVGVFALLVVILVIFNGGHYSSTPGLNLSMFFTAFVVVIGLRHWRSQI